MLSGVIIAMTSSEKFKKHQKTLRRRNKIILRYIRRRQRKISLLVFLMCEYLRNQTRERRSFWIEPSRGKTQFWEETVSQWKDHTLWLENFRLSKESFLFICRDLNDTLKRKDTRFRKSTTCRKAFSHLFLASCYWGRSAFPWLEIWYRKKHCLPDSKRSLPGYRRCAFT